MGCELCWRVTSLSGDVVCTIYHDDEAVEVRAAFSDGIVVRTRRTSDIEPTESSRPNGWRPSEATLWSWLQQQVAHGSAASESELVRGFRPDRLAHYIDEVVGIKRLGEG